MSGATDFEPVRYGPTQPDKMPYTTDTGRSLPPLDTSVAKDDARAQVDVESANPTSTDSGSPQSLVPKEGDFGRRRTQPTDPMAGGNVNYKSMNWINAGLLMIAETISLGILGLPSCIAKLGLVPGVMVINGMGVLSAYCGYVIGQFKLKYPHVVSMADAGELLFGRVGREVFGIASSLMFICYMAAHILTFSICFNVITGHATCTLVFGFVGFVVSVLLTIPRTMKKVSYMSLCSFLSIATAVMITMIALGVSRKGGSDIDIIVHDATFYHTIIGIMDIVMAYAGNVAFFSFISELANPREFPKALALLQTVTISIYTIVAVVIYYYGGTDIASPALGATSLPVRKTAYIVAIPTILIAGVINAHIAGKYFYVRFCSRGTPPLYQQKSVLAWAAWLAIVTATWLLAWIIASAIPNFNQLLALVSALFGTWFTFGIPGMLWIYMNMELLRSPWRLLRRIRHTWRKVLLTALNLFSIAFALGLCVVGMYVSIVVIGRESLGKSFSCDDNSEQVPPNSTTTALPGAGLNTTG